MKKHRKLTLEEVKAYLDRAMSNLDLSLPDLDLSLPDLQFDNVDLDLIDDEFLLEPASGSPGAAKSGEAPLPMSGTTPICIRLPNRVINAFKLEADKKGTRYQTLINRTLNTATGDFS